MVVSLVAEAKPQSAAKLTGSVAGRSFPVVSALGVGDPSRPGVLFLTLSDKPIACDTAPPDDATVMVLGFEPVVGSPSVGGLVLNKRQKLFGALDVKGALLTLPAAVGATGTVRIDAISGEGNALSGELSFVGCEVVGPLPPLEATFESREVDTGHDADAARVTVGVPVGWTEGYDQLGIHTWNAPDGRTTFSVDATCAGACDSALWAANARGWQDDQTSAFRGVEGWSVELGRNDEVSPGTRLVRYTLGYNGAASITTVAVLRYDAAWEQIFVCQLKTETKNTTVLDGAEKACLSLSPRT